MQFFLWIADNWQSVCAWATGIYLAIHLGRVFIAVVLAINSIGTRFKAAEGTLSSMANNHLPHIQEELEKTNEILRVIKVDLRRSLKLEEYEQETHFCASDIPE